MSKLPPSATPPWFVITGGPSVGKTTIINELQNRGFEVVQEAARQVIDDSIKNGISVQELRKDEKKFQEEVTRQKIATEKSLNKNQIAFLDRGMHDTIAYMKYYNFDIADWIYEAVSKSKYENVFILEPLTSYKNDYARVEDQGFINKIDDLLYKAYEETGLKPLVIPSLPVDARINLIVSMARSL